MELGKEVIITDEYGIKVTAYETGTKDGPYLEYYIKIRKYNPNYGDNKVCKCGHIYARHFDSYDDMADSGCKYCGCDTFIPREE